MSLLARKLRAGSFPVSLEITPPRRPRREILLRRAHRLGDRADAIDVIHRPDRMSSLDASLVLLSEGFEPVWHLVNRGRTRVEVEQEIARAVRAGIAAVLCIRGDHVAQDGADTPKIREVVRMALDAGPGALVGVTMNQYLPARRVVQNLMPKLRAGASFVQSQPVLSVEGFRALAQEVKSRSPETAIVPMLMPLRSVEALRTVRERLSLPIPDDLGSRIEAGGEPAGWDVFAETLSWLYESPLADGVAVMALETDPPPDFGPRAVAAIDRLREGEPPVRPRAGSSS